MMVMATSSPGLSTPGGERLRNEVERLARIAREDDLGRLGAVAFVHRADEPRDLRADAGDGLGCLDGERVQAAQRIGVSWVS